MTKTAFDPAPTQLERVLDPAWLTDMLRLRWPGVTVRGVEVVETLVTQATKARIRIDLDGAGSDVPTALCIKGILTKTQVPTSASVTETLFYRDCAAEQPVLVPPCFHAQLNNASDNGVIVMQDMIVAGAQFLTALKPFAPQDTRDTLNQLAKLHAAAWQGSTLFNRPWIPRFLDSISQAPIIPCALLQEMLDGPRGECLSPLVRDAARLQRGLEQLAAQVRARSGCVIHGDAHAGNVFRTDAGHGLVDWQVVQKGEWAQDIAYHIAAVLSPEDRRAHERDLLDHYRDRLRAHGGPDVPVEEAWTRYRAAMIYGYYLWAITRKVDPQITNEFVRRLGLAVEELDSFSAVQD